MVDTLLPACVLMAVTIWRWLRHNCSFFRRNNLSIIQQEVGDLFRSQFVIFFWGLVPNLIDLLLVHSVSGFIDGFFPEYVLNIPVFDSNLRKKE